MKKIDVDSYREYETLGAQFILDSMEEVRKIMNFTPERVVEFFDGYRPDYTVGFTSDELSYEHNQYLSFFTNYGEFILGFEAYYNYMDVREIKKEYLGGIEE